MKIAVLMTCHNRRDKTVACLAALDGNHLPEGVDREVFLVDDGSTDGTSDAVGRHFPTVRILHGDGSLFWNRGMHKAFEAAMADGFDAYLWLNDDTLLDPNALEAMMGTWKSLKQQLGRDVIVVGSTRDAMTGRTTYGGVIRPVAWKRTTFAPIEPGDIPKECETMDGNCVLVPQAVAKAVGNLDFKFTHAMGDFDYGLRARQAGFSAWVMPGHVGTCAHNPISDGFKDASLSLRMRLRKMMQPTGLPPAPWRIFTQRYAGTFWFAFWLWPYMWVVLDSLMRRKKVIWSILCINVAESWESHLGLLSSWQVVF